MSDFETRDDRDGFACKLWRGERMTMIGFDVTDPEDDLVGFSIEVRAPGSRDFEPLKNRIAFAYPEGAGTEVDGNRNFDSREAPFQKFRWMHFPWKPVDGTYRYRVAKRHMPRDGEVVGGTTLKPAIENRAITYDGLLDIGFTRNFASSQAYADQFGNNQKIIPKDAKDGLDFAKLPLANDRGESVYRWLGFEAHDLLFGFLDKALADPDVTLDALAYDLNEPDIVAKLEAFGPRLRVIIDDSSAKEKGVEIGHKGSDSAESRSAARFRAAGATVSRTHFHGLQHHKVFVTRRDGTPEQALCGSTNFTFRGLYIQSNNMIVFHSAEVAGLFGRMFDLALDDPQGFRDSDFAKTWHVVPSPKGPIVQVCFSPHLGTETDLSLNPIRAAIDQATSSVFYSVAFLGQMTKGPTVEAFRRLMARPVFSYGTVDQRLGLELRKPDGSVGLVDFKYLARKAPQPFKAEWSGTRGRTGRNVHHKFVITDFSLPTAKVFTGSSNFSPSGETNNGDHLIMIEDRKIATAYALEAARVFDHLQFRNRMAEAFGPKDDKLAAATAPKAITLRKPAAFGGGTPWFARFYKPSSQRERDRKLFST